VIVRSLASRLTTAATFKAAYCFTGSNL
jgi:hypothetical protein